MQEFVRKWGGIKSWAHGFALHIITGLAAVAVHYSLMWFTIKLGAVPVVASSSGFLAGALVRFLLSYRHVFSPTIGAPTALFRFVAALALQMMANALLLGLLIQMNIGVWSAQIVATAVLTVVNYMIYRLWVFL